MSRRDAAEVVALVAVAVAVRIVAPSAVWYVHDQTVYLEGGRAVLAGAWFAPGPTIGWSELRLGPLFNWIVALGLAPRNDPTDAVVLLGLVHGATLPAWRRLLERWGGDAGRARLATWALALHPLAIATGGAFWHTALVLPTVLLFLWGVERWLEARAPGGFGMACVGAALMVQAHAATVLLLPMALLGVRRRAPIGRAGLVGLALGLAILAPMIASNLRALVRTGGIFAGVRHAGGGEGGASYPVALVRALALEMLPTRLSPSGPSALRTAAIFAAVLWLAAAAWGVVVTLRRPPAEKERWLLGAGLVVPTLVIPALPRGALFYYLDCTLPLRCWLFASGICALGLSWRRLSVPCGLVLLAPAALLLVVRLDAWRTGVVRSDPMVPDLRAPWSHPVRAMAIPTLGAHRAVGEVLAAAGAVPGAVRSQLRGPWQWAFDAGVAFWVAEAVRPSGHAPSSAVPRGAADPTAFLVLHDGDAVRAPGRAERAGPFRVHVFEDRAVPGRATAGRLDLTLRAGLEASVIALVAVEDARPRLFTATAELPLSRERSDSGLGVWSAIVPAGPSGGPDRPLSIELGARVQENLFLLSRPSVYAFTP